MPRIRQLFPLAYLTNSSINSEFEQLIRYLNAAELGNKSLAELMQVLFDSDGELVAPVEIRLDPERGLEYRIGEYQTEAEGWQFIANLADLRGAPGLNIGQVMAPVFYGRADFDVTAGTLTIDYAHQEDETLVVYKSGMLLREGPAYDYTTDATAGTLGSGQIIFSTPLSAGDLITAFKIRTEAMNAYKRLDFDLVAPQAIFPINYINKEDLSVYKNGILLREGGAYDYVAANLTITLMHPASPGDLITILKFDNSLSQTVSGFMMEKDFVEPASGLIRYSRLTINDGQIPTAKVAGLGLALSSRPTVYLEASAPNDPLVASFWLNTALAEPNLHYFNGLAWVQINPENRLPTFGPSNINQILRVAPNGTGLEWGNIDLSGYVSLNRVGASNGVAGLDSQGRMVKTQLPEVSGTHSIYYASAGAIVNGKFVAERVFKQKLRLIAVAIRTESGTASVTLSIGGVKTGSTFTASSTPSEFPLGSPINIDAMATSIGIGFEIENANATNNLEVTIVAEVLNV